MKIILPPAYLAPISYYYWLVNFRCEIDVHAHYHKQTIANRCEIATAHGIEKLVIPVEHTDHTPLHEVRISAHHNWQTLHWRAFEAAYNASPFFDYYKDDLRPLFLQPFSNLTEWNLAVQRKILELLDYDVTIELSTIYKKNANEGEIDLRSTFLTPKKVVTLQPNFNLCPYYQVFEPKIGFQADLSIVDLLFNMGNEARLVLKQ